MGDKGLPNRFFGSGQITLANEKEKRKKRDEEKKARVALLVFILATLEKKKR